MTESESTTTATPPETPQKTPAKTTTKKTTKKKPKPKPKPKPKVESTPTSDAITAIEKQYGEGSIQYGNGNIVDCDVVHTGVVNLDVALGVAGIPKGRIIEIFGNESGGKTTLCLQIIASCQKTGGKAAFIDAEHALDPSWAAKLGVDMSKVLISQPDSGEEGLCIAETLVNHGAVDLVIVDSVAALAPLAELEGAITDIQVGAQARMMSKSMRRLAGKVKRSNTAVIFVNQIREKIGVTFGSPETTPGGRALKFYSSVRIEVSRSATFRQSEKPVGVDVRTKIVKSKVSPPFRTAVFRIYFGSPLQAPEPMWGVDLVASLVTGASEVGALEIRGSNYYFDGAKIANGKDATSDVLRGDEELYNKIVARTYENLKDRAKPKDTDDDGFDETEESDPVPED